MAKEEMPVIPATDPTDQYIQKAGIYLLQPVRIAVWKDKNGVPQKDKLGNPGLYITFKNPNGEMLSSGFYYSAYALNDPKRQDEAYRCKSEYQLANLKSAMGFAQNVTVQPEAFLAKKVWAPVKEVQHYTPEGEYVKSSFDIVKKFFPYLPETTSKGKPSIMGDPETTDDHKPSGDFLEVKTDSPVAGTGAAPRERRPRPTEDAGDNPKPVETEGEANEGYTGEVSNEPPDY